MNRKFTVPVWLNRLLSVIIIVGVPLAVYLHYLNDAMERELHNEQLIDRAFKNDVKDLNDQEIEVVRFLSQLWWRQPEYVERSRQCEAQLQTLLQAPSFKNKKTMLAIEREMDDCVNIDLAIIKEKSKRIETLPSWISAQSWPPQQKKDLITAINSIKVKSIEALNGQMESEQSWRFATHDLYEYAQSHATMIHPVNDKIVIKDRNIRIEFQRRLDLSDTLHQQFIKTHGTPPQLD